MARLSSFALCAVLASVYICHCSNLARYDSLDLTKIVNGQIASIRDFPYIVSLQNNGTFYGHDYEHFCCGSILNERWIITSAQCAQPNLANFHIRAGSSIYYEKGDVYEVEQILIHPGYNAISRDYDFGLIKVSRDISFNEYVEPIELPQGDEEIQAKSNLSIVGWGATELLEPMSDELRSGHVLQTSEAHCKSVYGDDAVTPRMFCVFEKGYGPCVGDSGSPAVLRGRIIGVTSWSYGCAHENPSVYARLSSVLGWIRRSIQP